MVVYIVDVKNGLFIDGCWRLRIIDVARVRFKDVLEDVVLMV